MALTKKQADYALAIAEGASSKQAAVVAGYSYISEASIRTQASRLANDPNIQQAISEHRQRRLNGPMASKALACLEGIMDDLAAPPAARVAAAKWVLEAAGLGLENRRLVARHPEDTGRGISAMTLGELEELVASAELRLKKAQGHVIAADATGEGEVT